ncbi:aminotransferase class I/II-fold pyridoxal phosphate-dependent enzyme, partial [Acidobacteria bacterium AH-259-L09]|nr:aminotransferase class I/II-fold pyridoxal phosphate-dependent enzyme [Acidobacteria bacterium AH-259-L09]
SQQMRGLVDQAMDRILDHIESLPQQPASNVDGGLELARSLREPLPEQGQPYSQLLDLLFERALPKTFNAASPGYLAYIPGGGIFHAALADLIADAVNRYVGVWIAAPGLVQLEVNVIRWFCDMMGYPPQAGGVLTSGGSLANLIALITARRERLPEDFLRGVLYSSDQTHHSVKKAAVLAGFPPANIREIASDSLFRIQIDALQRRMDQDKRDGWTPFMIVGNAGTTNTGAVDNLESLSHIASQEKVWFHVDAAYGGFFLLTERGRRLMSGIERADSITLDPHKGLFLPYGTGSLLVRDQQTLKRAHTLYADYMPPLQKEPDLVDFCELSPELSRGFRGLRVWLPLKMHGIEPFRRNLEEKLDLTQWAAEELRKIPGIEIVVEPQLSVVAFHLVKPGLDLMSLNQLNQQLLEQINARRRIYLTPTLLDERFVIRICVLSFRTHLERMQAALEDIRTAVSKV